MISYSQKNLQMRKSADRPENTRATEQYSQMLLLLWAGISKENDASKNFLAFGYTVYFADFILPEYFSFFILNAHKVPLRKL